MPPPPLMQNSGQLLINAKRAREDAALCEMPDSGRFAASAAIEWYPPFDLIIPRSDSKPRYRRRHRPPLPNTPRAMEEERGAKVGNGITGRAS